jgi:dCTP diphosphatase
LPCDSLAADLGFATGPRSSRIFRAGAAANSLDAYSAELLEHFQWLKEEESKNLSPAKLAEVRRELADVFIYLVRIADKLGVDLIDAAKEKIVEKGRKYPVERAKGSSRKYSEL